MAAGNTYTPIATTTLGSNTASYTFSSIPATYTDLVIVMNYSTANLAGLAANVSGQLRINSDAGGNYSQTLLYGFGSTANSGRESNQSVYWIGDYGYLSSTSGVFGNTVLNFMNYKNTTTYKTFLERTSNIDDTQSSSMGSTAGVGLWRSTSAITSITLMLGGTSVYRTGSTFTLYGIAAA
jgi:hypothetical protein